MRVEIDNADKRAFLLAYLDRGVTMIHVDARRADVLVPPQFKEESHLRLNLSYRYKIPDLEATDQRIAATLSFGGSPFWCEIPWGAVFGITFSTTGEGQIWGSDIPPDVLLEMQAKKAEGAAEVPAKPEPEEKPKPAWFKGVVDGGKKGFTLVETVIVLFIVGILAMIAIGAWDTYRHPCLKSHVEHGLVYDPIYEMVLDEDHTVCDQRGTRP